MESYLAQDIKFLAGVGPKRADLLTKELQVATFRDLLYTFPYKYEDRSKVYKIRELSPALPYIQVKGRMTNYSTQGHGRSKRLTAWLEDETGRLELVWFKGTKWIPSTYKEGKEYLVFGKPSLFNGSLNVVHPEIEDTDTNTRRMNAALQAFYPGTEKLRSNFITSRVFTRLLSQLFQQMPGKIPETLPSALKERLKLMNLHDALLQVHFPQNPKSLDQARYRLKFEELFYIQLNLLRYKQLRTSRYKGHIFEKVGDYLNSFYKESIPFDLTGAQKRVLKEIRANLGSGKQMNRLLQGDVGSGKTMVALMSMLIGMDNGYQSCLMAPTEILARQHYKTISDMLGSMKVEVRVLTGSTPKGERTELFEKLEKGQVHILIGTHALLEDPVVFHNLGLVVIDEQHRFGVAQRARLWKKNVQPPHVLVMTATPIPRTLAMTLYGDLDVSVIDELPPGRKPVKTIHYTDAHRLKVFGFLKKQIAEGRQIFVVYPLISESEKMDYKDLEDGYESISRAFPPPQYAVSIVHGRMKADEKETAMKMFRNGRTHILVATTVIEVGVDIPNASVMVIESAERFGLSQLHQLRGRVGRGSDQSWCILMSSVKLSNEGRKRLETMVRTNDGFEIAEVDLQLRGPGDMEGTRQSGMAFELRMAHLGKDSQILEYARQVAERLLEEDPELKKPEYQLCLQQLKKMKNLRADWSAIS